MPGTSKLSLYNGALLILKEAKLDTLTDHVKARFLLDQEYDKCVQSMLEEGDWNFASRTIALEADVEIEPAFGFTYAFEKPLDHVRLVSISANATGWPQLDRYREETLDGTPYFVADCNPLYISYVSNDNNWGLDLSLWPQSFVLAVEHDLAKRVAPGVTSWDARQLKVLETDAMNALRSARAKDARSQAPQRPPPGRLVTSRMGRRGGIDSWRS